MPDETNGVNNAARCYRIEAVQLSASLVMSLFASFFYQICGTALNLVFFDRLILIKIAYTPLDRSAALILSVTD